MALPGLPLALLDAIEEPALVVEQERVVAANRPAVALLGERIVGRDVRLVLRHPNALDIILPGHGGERDIDSLGGRAQRWTITARPLPDGLQLVRLIDRSAAQTAERMRVDFVANASHELRTPLTSIIGYAETLAEAGPIDDSLRARFGATIHREARRMLHIVEDLMSLSRIEADRFITPGERVMLDDVAGISAENSSLLAVSGGAAIILDVGPAGPIAGDSGQLLQLTDNLVANALRYGSSKGGTSSVTIRTAIEGGRAVLSVIDQGQGIAPHHLVRVTERFYRVDAARSPDSGGTGLGLSIVKHIAERHQAKLEIRSEVGRGTHVAVSFPLLRA